jgi:hypothetical protein
VRRQLLEAGIPSETIPDDWLNYIVAATRKWIATSREGAADAADLLGMKTFRGNSDKVYALVAHDEVVEHITDGENVWFLQGLVVDGVVTDPSRLRISSKGREQCSSCGTLVSCVKTIRDPYSDRLETLCNKCITFSDHPQVRDQGGLDICRQCTVTTCANHPRRTHSAFPFGVEKSNHTS